MTQKPLLVANWKMNPVARQEAEHLFNTVKNGLRVNGEAKIVFCPPFVWLPLLARDKLQDKKSHFFLGGQDCAWQEKGAYTVAISPLMLKELGCQYVIIGHSERKKYFQETDEIINQKIKAALKTRLIPILCVGEETRDAFDENGRQLNEMSLVVGEQLVKSLNNISVARIREVVIAYEPIWAIGTGNPCLPDDAMKAALFIRKTLTKLYNRSIAEGVSILYGGSVNSKNAAQYIQEANMNGLLVGGASLNASEFIKLVENAIKV